MSNKKITELPIVETPDNFTNMVVEVDQIYKRVNVSENIIESEDAAIQKVKDIYAKGLKAFIIAYKE